MRVSLLTKRTIIPVFGLLCLLLFARHGRAQDLPGIEADGKPVPITPPGRYFMQPQWSPTGDALAFAGPNYQGIWVYFFATKKIKQLVDLPAAGYRFQWSPDGRYIAFRARYVKNKRGKFAIEVVDVQTGVKKQLTPLVKRLGLPQWGRDNSRIFFTQNGRLRQVATQLSTRPDLRKLPHPLREIIPFSRSQQIHIAEVRDTLAVRNLWPGHRIVNPVLSPAGDLLACEEIGGDLVVLEVDAGKLYRLGKGYRPAWSPDGRWICFMITKDDGHQYLESDIYVAYFTGKPVYRVTRTPDQLEMNPSWSPDGTAIAFDEHKTGRIYVQKIRFVK
jgi:Tol biopolymer transport system component